LNDCSDDDKEDYFTIRFETNGGSPIADMVIKSGSPVTKPEDPVKADSILDAWYTDAELYEPYTFGTTYYTTLGFTLYAKWAKPCIITFNTNGSGEIPPVTINSGKYVTKPADPVMEGFIFGGWYTDAGFTNLFNFSNPVSTDLTLYAKWDMERIYTVSFSVNGGNSVSSQELKHGEFVAKPSTSKSGNTLVGWYTDGSFQSPYDFVNTPVTSNLTLHTRWAVSSPESEFGFDPASGKVTAYKGNSRNVVIPEMIQGVPVKVLGFALFIDRDIDSVVLPGSVTTLESIKEGDFESVSRTFHNCSAKDINLFHTSITVLPKWTFMYAKIERIALPGTLEKIDQGAFEGSMLTTIHMPNSVKYVEPYSFFRCKSLTNVTIGKGILSINNGAFAESSLLSTITILREKMPVPSLGSDSPFRDIAGSFRIKVPAFLVDEYKGSWSSVSGRISGM